MTESKRQVIIAAFMGGLFVKVIALAMRLKIADVENVLREVTK